MSDEGSPFPADELDALVNAAELFGSAAMDWLAWAGEIEDDEQPDAYRLLREIERSVGRPIDGQTIPVVVGHVLDAIDASEIDVQAAVIAALALRIIVRRFELDVQEDR